MISISLSWYYLLTFDDKNMSTLTPVHAQFHLTKLDMIFQQRLLTYCASNPLKIYHKGVSDKTSTSLERFQKNPSKIWHLYRTNSSINGSVFRPQLFNTNWLLLDYSISIESMKQFWKYAVEMDRYDTRVKAHFFFCVGDASKARVYQRWAQQQKQPTQIPRITVSSST